MGAIGTTLTTEIQRISKKEIRKATTGVKKAMTGLKKEVAELTKALRVVGKAAQASAKVKPVQELAGLEAGESKAARFTPKSIMSLRKRLGVSQAELAKLAGVSTGSVFHWEKGKAKPRGAGIAGLRKLRAIGKSEARAVLDAAKSIVAYVKTELETSIKPAPKAEKAIKAAKPRRARKAKTEAKPAPKAESAGKAKPVPKREAKPKRPKRKKPELKAEAVGKPEGGEKA